MSEEKTTREDTFSDLFIKTSSSDFNEFMDGGFETGTINVLSGKGGVGKTKICFDAAMNTVFGNEEIGVPAGGKAIYIDAEDSISMRDLFNCLRARGLAGKFRLPSKKWMETKGMKTRKERAKYIRAAVWKQMKKKGFYYFQAHNWLALKSVFGDIFGSLLPVSKDSQKTGEYAVSTPDPAVKLLKTMDLVIIDSLTWHLVPQLKTMKSTATAMTRLYEQITILHSLAMDYEFTVLTPVQLLSELGKALKIPEKVPSDVVDVLAAEVDRDYVGGKAILHGPKTNIRILGMENPRTIYRLKHRSKATGSKKQESMQFLITDGGIKNFVSSTN